jgi:hypothetical protein
MKKLEEVSPGDLVVVNPNFNSGIWLRHEPGSFISRQESHVKDDFMFVIKVNCGYEQLSEDPHVCVLSSTGLFGWTFLSRLKKIK